MSSRGESSQSNDFRFPASGNPGTVTSPVCMSDINKRLVFPTIPLLPQHTENLAIKAVLVRYTALLMAWYSRNTPIHFQVLALTRSFVSVFLLCFFFSGNVIGNEFKLQFITEMRPTTDKSESLVTFSGWDNEAKAESCVACGVARLCHDIPSRTPLLDWHSFTSNSCTDGSIWRCGHVRWMRISSKYVEPVKGAVGKSRDRENAICCQRSYVCRREVELCPIMIEREAQGRPGSSNIHFVGLIYLLELKQWRIEALVVHYWWSWGMQRTKKRDFIRKSCHTR